MGQGQAINLWVALWVAPGRRVGPKVGLCKARLRWAGRRGRCRGLQGEMLGLLLVMAAVWTAQASMSLLLEQPYGKLGVVDPTGHSAIYLDHVCAATPLELRPCAPGELGVVLSRYDGIGHYDWVAMPLIPYLYAVRSAGKIPQSVDRAEVERLREAYRREYLESVAPDLPDGAAPPGNWYELVGSAFDRRIYGFRVRTTPEQDAQLIAVFNDRRNVEKYNLFRNCADFARLTIDLVYPHAVHRNWIGDLGLTSPKSVARGLTHFGHKHPEAQLRVFMIEQVKGTLPRSHATEGVTESLLKRYGLPLVAISPVTTGVVLAAYVGHGRFAMPKNPELLDIDELEERAERTGLGSSPPIAPPDPPEVVLAGLRTRIEP